ncbi:cyclin-J-like protein isoform X3 [Callorhinus ursinus]|uniref:cyclin-J-like protein isoform X3 n=1 Tax=Callorhinus ursinus TaxID=34884 RepID=UPI003CD0396F
MMDEPWWEGRVASDVHCTLREKELKLPAFRAHSPLLKSRRFFIDILNLLSGHCQLCPTARHLAVYLLDHFLDRYNITASKQLYAVAVSCLLLASKFEDREDHVPKLEQINSMRILSGQNFTLTKKELLNTELLLLEAFSWNLCLPTPAHFLDYYLLASVSQKDHHCHSWSTACPRKTKECLREYAHYFLEVTLQDHIFYKFQPSVVAAACVGASRICLQLSPYWTRDLQRISNYTLEHLSTCIEILLVEDLCDLNFSRKAIAFRRSLKSRCPPGPGRKPWTWVFTLYPCNSPVTQEGKVFLVHFARGQDKKIDVHRGEATCPRSLGARVVATEPASSDPQILFLNHLYPQCGA